MAAAKKYLTRTRYAAAISSEVGGVQLFRLKILDASIMIYRNTDSEAVAVHDRCPHRFAPLHLGKREGDEVDCAYPALMPVAHVSSIPTAMAQVDDRSGSAGIASRLVSEL